MFLFELKKVFAKINLGHLSKDGFIAWCAGFLVLLLFQLLLWDGYLFYNTVLSDNDVTPKKEPQFEFREDTITDTLSKLRERKKRFERVLSNP